MLLGYKLFLGVAVIKPYRKYYGGLINGLGI